MGSSRAAASDLQFFEIEVAIDASVDEEKKGAQRRLSYLGWLFERRNPPRSLSVSLSGAGLVMEPNHAAPSLQACAVLP
jgi:hypothetical protein